MHIGANPSEGKNENLRLLAYINLNSTGNRNLAEFSRICAI